MDKLDTPIEKIFEELTAKEGQAFQDAYDKLMSKDPHSKGEIDDYIITASFEPAEGMYLMQTDQTLKWVTPGESDNQHFEVIVQDKKDLRFIPYLYVVLKLFDEKENVVAEKEITFIWHPFVYHYGINGEIPREGDFIPEVTVRKPLFPRHDQVRGNRYAKDVTIRLASVHLKPGKKPFGPE